MQRRVGNHYSDVVVTRRDRSCESSARALRNSTIGACGDISSAASSSETYARLRADSIESTIMASGLCTRRLIVAQSCDGCFAASRRTRDGRRRCPERQQCRLRARLPRRARCNLRPAAAFFHSRRSHFKPRFGTALRQAIGSALKRRFEGSRYSRSHWSHSGKSLSVVLSRS